MVDQRSHSQNKSKSEVLEKRAISLRGNNPIWGLSFSQEFEYFILNEMMNNMIGIVNSTYSYI